METNFGKNGNCGCGRIYCGSQKNIFLSAKIQVQQNIFSLHGDIKRDEICRTDNKSNALKNDDKLQS